MARHLFVLFSALQTDTNGTLGGGTARPETGCSVRVWLVK